jgi:hypothetical protein
MAHPYYTEKILPFLEQHKVTNLLVKTPFIGTGFELKELAKTLRPDEELRYITACKSGNAKVLVCVTNLRLHILDKGLILNKYQLTVDLSKIASVQRGRGVFFGSVVISVLGYEDNIYLNDFWGKDTEDFQRILQDAITDFGLGRSQNTTNSDYYRLNVDLRQYPTMEERALGSRDYRDSAYQMNNPTYNYLTGEPYTESELLAMGLDRFGNPLESSSYQQRGHSRATTVNRETTRTVNGTSSANSKPLKDVSDLSTSAKFDALDSGGFGSSEQLRQAKMNLEDAYRKGIISKELYEIKMRKYNRGLL